ncbi:tRNA (adenosine(37)-N6)-threonylcarbamoyltransferase complex dimerization subunit type 1 TsaB [Taibaiella sp. KBW10]|uniref:tRNA (adenosine(37)-N6)-threonylcarbamoyltransferase complex dimerization subunit type 1 TsaB n=1 Tax=Taibaiella sp. KBW10 TaxID=2153357 RepID=UPI001315A29B|nr:tRNA (adenosine(37)-N6)-threonylcarbamoyltransferase complex dimerization subunit type 1 TsaB [Taibaiella sp. KBW10]
MANILFIDTAAQHTHVAIGHRENGISELVNTDPNQQAASLNEMIARVCDTAQLSLKDIDAVAVDAGPGSYTGLRVGLGVAKGICFALDKPLMLFSKLALIADAKNTAGELLVVLKARTGEGFAMATQKETTLLPAQHIFYDTFDFHIYATGILLTDDSALLERFPEATILENHLLDMHSWNALAQKRWEEQAFDDLAYAEPFYLKAAFTTAAKNKL